MTKRPLWALGACGVLLLAGTSAFAEVHYTSSGLRDPFVDPGQKTASEDNPDKADEALGKLPLNGILFSAENPRAIINNKIYAPDDKIGRKGKIVSIEKDRVRILSNGKEIVIKLTMGKNKNEAETREFPIKKSV